MAYGQQYKDLPFDERFGNWQEDQTVGWEDIRQQAIQRLIDEFEQQRERQRQPEYTWPHGFIRI